VLKELVVEKPGYPDNDTAVYKHVLKSVFVGDGVKKTQGYVTQANV